MPTYPKPTKAIIAAAGFGTRFLPQTKAMPKEMLPIVDKPIIQYVVEGLVQEGIKDIIIVTGYSKRSIEDHFDTPNAELSALLQAGGKQTMLDGLNEIADMANFAFVRQKEPLGNIAALYYARHLVQGEPFIYTWADEFVEANPSLLSQTLAAYEQTGSSILPCIRITKDEEFDRYGIVGGEEVDDLLKLNTIAEKPGRAAAPSDLASVGGYLLTPDILPYIEALAKEYNGTELKIQTAMQSMIADKHALYAYEIKNAAYHDAGNKLEYLKTVVNFGLRRDDIGEEFRSYLQERLNS
ncbi:MAG TPA: UTP--glucose-1-phosphate uridylyltransferase [Candidatus Saccharimonadales bacterium]|nr:UTP--glucose-1-phosphate uridylyltransferase [Candidatus Saccharimonadales bacterium]